MAAAGRILPLSYLVASGAPGVGAFALNQTTDAIEYIFQAPEAITITRLGIQTRTITGTAPEYKISLQGVDATGIPDGTIKSSGNASALFTPSAANTWNWYTLTSSYTCTRGELLAVVVAHNSGTIDGPNNVSFMTGINSTSIIGFPYTIEKNDTTRTRNSALSAMGFASAGTAYGMPVASIVTQAINTGTTPDEVGILFTLPAGWGDTYKIVGVRVLILPAAGGTFDVKLYDTDGSTVLQQVSFDQDHFASNAAARMAEIYFDETTLSTLTFGSAYRLTILPTSATNLTLYGHTVSAPADMSAWPGGANVQRSQRTDAGSWTDGSSTYVWMCPILDDITEPAGGGGGLLYHPGMVGGIRG